MQPTEVVTKMENEVSVSLSSLVSRESETTCLDEVTAFMSFAHCSTSEEEEEYVEIMMERETEFGFKKGQSFVFGNFLKCARLDAIAWILKVFFLLQFFPNPIFCFSFSVIFI